MFQPAVPVTKVLQGIHNSEKGYSLRSTTAYGLWSGVARRGRPRPVARKSASVSIWGVRTACVMSR